MSFIYLYRIMNHELFMNRCFSLAQQARGFTAPNPMVGAVLVYNQKIIGEGWHQQYGGNHAEVNCLNNVEKVYKHLIHESTLYVNLEPCAHQGNTPPCADRLVQEKIKHVVIANTDPFAQVNGRGLEILKQGGVAVTTGVMEKEGLWLNRRFFCFHTFRRPYIILKWAQTADGFIAPADRSRLQITGEYSQLLVHKWRTEEAAVMVGSTTAMNDNPQLTARLYDGRQPLRIITDRNLQLPDTHHIFDKKVPTWIVNELKDETTDNLEYVKLNYDEQFLEQLMERLYEGRILSLIVEGGSALLNSFINEGLWDEVRKFTGKSILNEGIPAPQLKNGDRVLNTFVEQDTLDIFVNNKSPYSYVRGMDF